YLAIVGARRGGTPAGSAGWRGVCLAGGEEHRASARRPASEPDREGSRMTTIRAIATGAALALAAGGAQAQAPASSTFDAVKARGTLSCGVSTGLAGFSLANSQGEWTGIDVDVCRAVAAAMLGGAQKVTV